MKVKKIVFVLLALALTVSCSSKRKTIDVRSPCVSNDGGPCGPKRSINDWWLNNANS